VWSTRKMGEMIIHFSMEIKNKNYKRMDTQQPERTTSTLMDLF
jgi:hypothetical protein